MGHNPRNVLQVLCQIKNFTWPAASYVHTTNHHNIRTEMLSIDFDLLVRWLETKIFPKWWWQMVIHHGRESKNHHKQTKVEGYICKLWKRSEPLRASSSVVKVFTAYWCWPVEVWETYPLVGVSEYARWLSNWITINNISQSQFYRTIYPVLIP